MSDRPVIPDEAVEAALSALFPDRATVSPFTRAVQEPIIRTILEAAAPYMIAGAWDEGRAAGWNDCLGEWWAGVEETTPNPYREDAENET